LLPATSTPRSATTATKQGQPSRLRSSAPSNGRSSTSLGIRTTARCTSFELGVPELRAWTIKRFPYVIFYVELDPRIDVWRVLHARCDVPATLADLSE